MKLGVRKKELKIEADFGMVINTFIQHAMCVSLYEQINVCAVHNDREYFISLVELNAMAEKVFEGVK